MPLKIAVYGIAKNEAKHVERFMETARESDMVYILDTGSTDETRELFVRAGAVCVKGIDRPFRFDEARNEALALVPADFDVCVSLDIDEVISPGWRRELEASFKNAERVRNEFIFSRNPDGSVSYAFWCDRIHARQNYTWICPVHETLQWGGPERERQVWNSKIKIEHFPDRTKSREQYLGLLELAVKERETDTRMMFYLTREYWYKSQWQNALVAGDRYIANKPVGHWPEENASLLCIMGDSMLNKGHFELAQDNFEAAIALAPNVREPWVRLGHLYWKQKKWALGRTILEQAEKLTRGAEHGVWSSIGWTTLLPDTLGLCCYELGDFQTAYIKFSTALEMSPNDERLMENKKWAFLKLGGIGSAGGLGTLPNGSSTL